MATRPFQRARVPAASADLPEDLVQMHSVDYRNPGLLPPGAVLVVGSGASGAQIAEELAAAGRSTYLCLSRHRRVPRRHWMHTFKSGTFLGIGDDAAYVADHLAIHLRHR